MSSPILHRRSKAQIDNFLRQPTHGLLITGGRGAGKIFTAKWIANRLDLTPLHITALEDKKGITIEQIRELYTLTRSGSNIMVIIEDSHNMSTAAQNAFLKLLEEPPKNIHFILTALAADSLLSTIRSRMQHIEIHAPEHNNAKQLITPENNSDAAALLYTTERLPGMLKKLQDNEELLELYQKSVTQAKSFYTANSYQRHIICIENKFDREWALELLRLLALIVESLMKRGSSNRKLIAQSKLIEETATRINKVNGNPKIHLARLCQKL